MSLMCDLLGVIDLPRVHTTPTSTKYVQKWREHIRWAHRKADEFKQKEVQCLKQNYDGHSGAVALREGDTVLVHVTTFKGRHKIQNQWENREYVVEQWPYPNLPVYVVYPRNREGCSQTLYRNYLLPISNNLEQAGDEPIDQLTPVPSAESGLPADRPTERLPESQPGLHTKQADPVNLNLTGSTTSDTMTDNPQAGHNQPAPLQQSAHTTMNQIPWRYQNFALQQNTTNPGAFDVWDSIHTCLHLMVGLYNAFRKKYSIKALYLKSVTHEQF